MIDMVSLLRKHHVVFDGPNRRGWLVLTCPKCGKPYLGWSCSSSLFFCWYDKGMPLVSTLSKLLHTSETETRAILEEFQSKSKKRIVAVEDKRTERPATLVWPAGIDNLSRIHTDYLISRGLDPDEVITQWHARGSQGGAAPLYANRIYAPLVYKGEEVSWQGRAVSRQNAVRYVTCPDALEVVPSKSLVYGWDLISSGKALIVEGLFDVWKGGPGCVHTFGVAWTASQLRLLSSLRTAVVAYDAEPQAIRAANDLAESLSGLGVKAAVLQLDQKDFGAMPVEEARAIVRESLAARF
jgi:hypothetical protein